MNVVRRTAIAAAFVASASMATMPASVAHDTTPPTLTSLEFIGEYNTDCLEGASAVTVSADDNDAPIPSITVFLDASATRTAEGLGPSESAGPGNAHRKFWVEDDPYQIYLEDEEGNSATYGRAQIEAMGFAYRPDADAPPNAVPCPPSPPDVSASDRRIVVDWDSPPNNGGSPVSGYTVMVREDWTAGSYRVIETEATQVTVDAENGTRYEVRVAASNAAGLSRFSDDRTVTAPTMATRTTLDPISPIVYGDGCSITGDVTEEDGDAITGGEVDLQRKNSDGGRWRSIGGAPVIDGSFTISSRCTWNPGVVRAAYLGTRGALPSRGDAMKLRVRAGIDSTLRDPVVRKSESSTIFGKLTPRRLTAHHPVKLSIRRNGKWEPLATARTDARSRWSFDVSPPKRHARYLYRVSFRRVGDLLGNRTFETLTRR